MPQNDRTELLYQIALTMVPAIGPITARKLIERIGSAKGIFKEKREALLKIEGIGPRMAKSFNTSDLLLQAEKELEFLIKHRISALYYKESGYPERLKQCADAPILLYTRGNEGLNPSHSISVVGTRQASPYGKDLCRAIVLGLSAQLEDLVIVSGLAFGIDVIAHRAALDGGIPTVAVLGHGLSTIYPHAHRETARRISQLGALVTDFHSGMGPERNNFLRRNRIIAGMADATLVVESAAAGGSLITANMAHSYDRDVLAVPGRTVDSRSRGCNRLIRNQVAALVESAEDVLHHLNWNRDIPQEDPRVSPNTLFSREEKKLLQLIQRHHPVDPGDLSIHSGLPIHVVLSLLTEMELKRWIAVEPGNLYQPRICLP
jgi:DNA processing protein